MRINDFRLTVIIFFETIVFAFLSLDSSTLYIALFASENVNNAICTDMFLIPKKNAMH